MVILIAISTTQFKEVNMFTFGIIIGLIIGLAVGVYLGAKIIEERDAELRYLREELSKAATKAAHDLLI